MALIQPPVDGEFYIDNATDNFWLRESGAWSLKGKLVRSDIVALVSPGPNTFTSNQVFELALGTTAVEYYQEWSEVESLVECLYPPAADCTVTFTNNLASFLARGENVICSAAFTPASQTAALTFTDTIVPANSPLWLVMPEIPDVAMAGLRALFAGMPQ